MHMPILLLWGLGTLTHSIAAAPSHFKLWGQVRDGESRGIPHALVVAGQDSCRADASGNYAFAALPPGPCALHIQADGHEEARAFVYLRKEAFLPLLLHRPRALTRTFATKARDLARPLATAGWDVDGDHVPDLAHWNSITGQAVEGGAGISTQDPWADVWLAERPFVGLDSRVTQGTAAFFGVKGGRGAWRGSARGPKDLVVEATSAEAGGARFSLEHALGPWHRLEAGGAWGRHSLPLAGDEAWSRLMALHLTHRMLPARDWHVQQDLGLATEASQGLESAMPAVWLPLSSAESWSRGHLSRRSVSWQGLGVWTPNATLRAEGQAWIRQRGGEARGWEIDRVLDRLPGLGRASSQRHGFDTRREEQRSAWGLRAALEQAHDRGLLQLGLELESQRRDASAVLGGDSLVAQDGQPWFDLREEQRHFAATLRDQWQVGEHLRLEAALDLRYFYYDLSRQDRQEWPDLAFNGDLLALNPRFAVGLGPQVELSLQRRNWLEDPARWWAPGRSPEAARDEALVAVASSTGELEALLPSPQEDELRLCLESAEEEGVFLWRWQLWGRNWKHLALPWWTREGQGYVPERPVQAMDAREAGSDLQLAWHEASWHLSLDATLTRAWLKGWLWRPLADTSLWEWEKQSLKAMPGLPRWQVMLELGHGGLRTGSWSVEPWIFLHLQGSSPNAWTPGVGAEQAANWGWRGHLDLRHAAHPRLSLRLWLRNGWAGQGTQLSYLGWQADLRQGQEVGIAAPPRQAGFTLSWSPRHAQ